MVRFSHRARVIDCYVIDGINGLEASTEPGAIHLHVGRRLTRPPGGLPPDTQYPRIDQPPPQPLKFAAPPE